MLSSSKKISLIVSICLSLPQSVLADPLAYVRASSQLNRDSTPSEYHPINLFDDKAETIWCEGADGLGEGEEISFFFKKNQLIDKIIVGPTAKTGRLIEKIRISDGVNSIHIRIRTHYTELELKKPLQGSTYIVRIEQVGGPNENAQLESDIACLAEIQFYYRNRPFGGKTPLGKIRYNNQKDRILGRWSGEPLGAPERFVVFALDGTWEWTFVPILEGKSYKLWGEYRFRKNRLLMRRGETGRWTDINFRYERINVDPDAIGAPSSDYDLISFNKALHDHIAGEYNNAKF